jgi:hypothetical protein
MDEVDRGRDEVDKVGNMAGASPATTFLLVRAKQPLLRKILPDEQEHGGG